MRYRKDWSAGTIIFAAHAIVADSLFPSSKLVPVTLHSRALGDLQSLLCGGAQTLAAEAALLHRWCVAEVNASVEVLVDRALAEDAAARHAEELRALAEYETEIRRARKAKKKPTRRNVPRNRSQRSARD